MDVLQDKRKDKFNKDEYRLINGAWTSHTPYGYCHCALHLGYISKANFKTHKCAKKRCRYFESNPDNRGVVQSVCVQKPLEWKKIADKQLRKEYLSGNMTLPQYNDAKERVERLYKQKVSEAQSKSKTDKNAG